MVTSKSSPDFQWPRMATHVAGDFAGANARDDKKKPGDNCATTLTELQKEQPSKFTLEQIVGVWQKYPPPPRPTKNPWISCMWGFHDFWFMVSRPLAFGERPNLFRTVEAPGFPFCWLFIKALGAWDCCSAVFWALELRHRNDSKASWSFGQGNKK